MGVVPERWDDEAAEALALAGEAPSPSPSPRCCMCECECRWDEDARCPADGSCRMSPRNPSRLGPCASAGAFWAGGAGAADADGEGEGDGARMGDGGTEWSWGWRRRPTSEGGAGTRAVASPWDDDRRRSGPRTSLEMRRTCAERPAMRAACLLCAARCGRCRRSREQAREGPSTGAVIAVGGFSTPVSFCAAIVWFPPISLLLPHPLRDASPVTSACYNHNSDR